MSTESEQCGWYVDVYDDAGAFVRSEECGAPTAFDTLAEHRAHLGFHLWRPNDRPNVFDHLVASYEADRGTGHDYDDFDLSDQREPW